MLMRLFMLLVANFLLISNLQAGVLERLFSQKTQTKAMPPKIRVLVAHDRPGVLLEVKGKYKVFDPNGNEFISTRFKGKRKFIQALNGGLCWAEEFPGVHQLYIQPDHDSVTVLVDGIEYRGSVYVFDVEGLISVVNEIYIEDYLKSLLVPQIRSEMPDELLSAIAIAARTTAYAQAEKGHTPYWDIDARSVNFQGYAVTIGNTPIENAIDATRFLIMSSHVHGNAADAEPFLTQWTPISMGSAGDAIAAQITLIEAENLARKGQNAAQVLGKAFPGSSVLLMNCVEPRPLPIAKN